MQRKHNDLAIIMGKPLGKVARVCMMGTCIALLAGVLALTAGCQGDTKGSASDSAAQGGQATAQQSGSADKSTDQAANSSQAAGQGQNQAANAGSQITDATKFVASAEATNYVDIEMDSGNHIVIELKPGVAPKTVENFQKLVKNHFYDGLTFHRVIDGFMIQGGDPQGNGTGGSDENILGEFKKNGVQNPLSHKRGVVSMARSQQYNSASSQFFICNGDATFLDGEYAAFGVVVRGMDEVDRIAKLAKDSNDKPNTPPVMKSVTFVTPEK